MEEYNRLLAEKAEHERWHGDHGSVSVFSEEFTDLRARIKSHERCYG